MITELASRATDALQRAAIDERARGVLLELARAATTRLR